jgi:DNA-binding NtrC family response regulator
VGVNTFVMESTEGDIQVASPMLYLVVEGDAPRAGGARWWLGQTDEVLIGRATDRTGVRTQDDRISQLTIGIPDRAMSSSHAKLVRSDDATTWAVVDQGSSNGTKVNGTPAANETLQDGDILELGQSFFLFRSSPLSPDATRDAWGNSLTGRPALRTLMPELATQLATLTRVATSDLPIILGGESGTGKEVAARAIHELSGRPGDFVPVNCGAIPTNLVEAQLFGSKRGAFSGATDDRPGLIKAADVGTLFLDEIGELPPAAQTALLRALQEREVLPVGATNPEPVDFRVVTATHRDLGAMVAGGEFREDLFARITGHGFVLPPLRDRMGDFGVIVDSILASLDADPNLGISKRALRVMLAYSWPRNIRQLRTCLEAAIVVAPGNEIKREHVEPHLIELGSESSGTMLSQDIAQLSDDQVKQRDEIEALLRAHKGNISAVAREMGRVRSQVQRWIRRYGLEPERYR